MLIFYFYLIILNLSFVLQTPNNNKDRLSTEETHETNPFIPIICVCVGHSGL